MKNLKTAFTRVAIRTQNNIRLAVQKLKEKDGSAEIVAALILCVVVVVIGGILLKLFGDSINQWWATLSGRITEMFNYK